MKGILIGNTKSYEATRLHASAVAAGHVLRLLPIRELMVGIEENVPHIKSVFGESLTQYDCYLFRGYGKHVWEIIVSARHVHSLGKRVVERKLATDRYVLSKIPYTVATGGVPVIDTRIIFSLTDEAVSDVIYPAIVRTTIGARGEGIFKVHSREELNEVYSRIGPKVLIQPYIPVSYDYRVMIVGNKVLGVMKKYHAPGSYVSNISAGGTAEVSSLPEEVISLCMKAKNVSNVEIAGVDVIEHEGKYYVLEVNAAPQFEGFERCTGMNVAREIIQYITEGDLSRS
ncbi:MAG: ATP-grasp domain-containing protein [Candidatus Dojkabacteria bacterium]